MTHTLIVVGVPWLVGSAALAPIVGFALRRAAATPAPVDVTTTEPELTRTA